MEFSVGCELVYTVKRPTPFLFNVEACGFPGQHIVSETLTFTPDLRPERWRMPESGNRYLRALVEPGEMTLRYEAVVDLTPGYDQPEDIGEIGPAALPLDVLTHLYPSRYCQSDKLDRFARRTFGDLAPGHERVNAICSWLHDNVDYVPGSSDALTSAYDTVVQRAGVCRDFAHLAIALCRALGIPARYVSAYVWRLDPPDFHAVVEAYLDGPRGPRWYLFDPTRKAAMDGIVRIGLGRDAAEVAFCSPFGEVESGKPKVWIEPRFEAREEITTAAVRPGG